MQILPMHPSPADVKTWFALIQKAVAPFPKAAMFELAERGYDSLFEQLISCLISIRTLDETTIPVSLKLFAKARTPKALLDLPKEELVTLLYGTQYSGQKADTMRTIAAFALDNGGTLPADYEQLTALKGVGPKCAKLALGVGAGVPGISVDVHVHRVVNRWPWVETATPEKTMTALEQLLPQEQWIDVNRLLMPFGKQICKAIPRCSVCPLNDRCAKRGVSTHQ